MKPIAIVCPVFREEEMIGAFHRRLASVLAPLDQRFIGFSIVYVLDPSPDRTESMLRDIAAAQPNVEVLVMSRRFRPQAALIAGIDHARADALIMLDQRPAASARADPGDARQMAGRRRHRADDSRRRHSRAADKARDVALVLPDAADGSATIQLPEGAADYRLISAGMADVFHGQLSGAPIRSCGACSAG